MILKNHQNFLQELKKIFNQDFVKNVKEIYEKMELNLSKFQKNLYILKNQKIKNDCNIII